MRGLIGPREAEGFKRGPMASFARAAACAASARVVDRGRRAVRGGQGVRAAEAPLNRREGPDDG
eukprot:743284-Prymnesium_polylepis.1